MRLPFLLLPPTCVLLGMGAAVWTGAHLVALDLILTMIGAVAAHISVNAFNEFHDARSGLDARTERTAFSGGSGVLAHEPHMAHYAFITASVAFAITGAIGLYFVWQRGIALLPLGLLGLLVIVAYTPIFTRHALMCLIAPGLGFGTFMVLGTYFVLSGHYSWVAAVASFVPFFLVNNLLLLNQFPDVEADRSVGRKHLHITAGHRCGAFVYATFHALTYLTIAAAVVFGLMPPLCLIGLATVILAIPATRAAFLHGADIAALTPALGMNVVINLLTPLLLAIGFYCSR